MLKSLLCMVIIIASAAIGLYLSSRLTQRVKLLSQLIVLLEEVASMMTYTSESLAKLFSRNFDGYPFSEQQPFDRQFCQWIGRYRDVLSADERKLLEDFSRGLGVSDISSQQNHIRLYITLLNEKRNETQEEVRNKEKTALILPLAVGIAIAILLI